MTLKIPFDSLTLRAVIAEWRTRLIGGQIQDVRQPESTDVTLGIRSQGHNYTLLLSSDPQFARAHLTIRRRGNTASASPPAFCMLLRKYIENALILDLRQREFDRILEIDIGTRAGGENVPTVRLVVELMGKHSNLILTTQGGIILDSAKRITHRINRLRETLPGLPYQSPPSQSDKTDPFGPDAVAVFLNEIGKEKSVPPEAWPALLLAAYAGLSPFLAGEIALRIAYEAKTLEIPEAVTVVWNEIFGNAAQNLFSPTLLRDSSGHAIGAYPFPLLQPGSEHQTPANDLNSALDLSFTYQLDRTRFQSLYGELNGKLNAEWKRTEKQQHSLTKTLTESARVEEYKQTGELLLANLWKIQPGMTETTLQDYFDPEYPDRTLVLDPLLSPQENAEAWFRRYRKARDGAEQARKQKDTLATSLYRLLQARERLESAKTEEELMALRTEFLETGLLRHLSNEPQKSGREKHESEFQGHKIRRYATPEGYEILFGESATANDYLTMRVAHTNDIWLHVRAAVSAHVVIRSQGKPDLVPRSVLEQAALLCAQHSQQKHSSLVSVDWTLKKYVRKPRGAAPGAADYTNENTIDVTPER